MIVGIIPARGGSKGIPRKNIKTMAGFPLIYWTIAAAKQSKRLDQFYVSTEDDEIARVAEQYGARVLKRPQELAQDDTTTLALLQHIVQQLDCQTIVVLQPTSPLRDFTTIDSSIQDYCDGGFDTLATGYFTKIVEYGTHQNLRRQDIAGFFYDDGNVYIIDRKVIQSGRWFSDNLCRKVLPKELNFEIDDVIDFSIVEFLLQKRLHAGQQPSEFFARLRNIQFLATDVDGVLTDAGMYYSETGDELKKFNTRDGMGLSLLRSAGVKTAILTSENTNLVRRRAKKIGVDYLVQGCQDKLAELEIILGELLIDWQHAAFIGDDLNDLSVLNKVGFPISVPDGAAAVKKCAAYITSCRGGDGAVREVCDLILQVKNQ